MTLTPIDLALIAVIVLIVNLTVLVVALYLLRRMARRLAGSMNLFGGMFETDAVTESGSRDMPPGHPGTVHRPEESSRVADDE